MQTPWLTDRTLLQVYFFLDIPGDHDVHGSSASRPEHASPSDEPYRFLVQGVVEYAIYMLAPDGTVTSWNAGAERMKGYRAAEVVGRNFALFYSAEDRAHGAPERTLDAARRYGKLEGEGWRVRKDGSRFWASTVVDALHNDDGQLIGFAKITRDVTERSIKEEQRQIIVDAAPNGMLTVDETGAIVMANAQAERIFGFEPASLAGVPLQRLLPGDATAQLFDRRALRSLETSSTLSQFWGREELTGKRRDGGEFPVEVTFNATPTARGPIIVASVADITERQAIEAERRRSESRLLEANRLMLMVEEMAHYGHWRIDTLSKVVFWSDEVYRISGMPLTHQPTLEAGLAAYDPSGVDVGEIVRRALLDGAAFSYESRLLRPDGKFRDIRCLGQGDYDAGGSLVGLIGIIQDITERKDAERERNRLMERVTVATQAGKVGIWEWGVAAPTMAWDAHMFMLYGLSSLTSVASYDVWRDALHPRDRQRVVGEVNDAVAGRKPFDTEFIVVWPNGELHTIRAQATVLRNNADEPVRMVGINWDITEVRGLAEQLRDEAERQLTKERERLYEHERKWSTTFQRAVLPLALPSVPGCTFDAVYEPGLGDGQVGGDWYDAFRMADGRILVSIGDVSGSGLEAAVVVGVVRQIIRGIAQLHADPMLILDAADRALCLEYPGVYVTAWIGIVDLVAQTVTYSSAGHPPPLIVAASGGVRELSDTTLPIGLNEGHQGNASTVALTDGDTLVLYTDGVTEATKDVIAGSALLRSAAVALANTRLLRPAEQLRRRVIPTGSHDDVAILILRLDLTRSEQDIERWRFDVRDGDAAYAARKRFAKGLRAYGFAANDVATAELVFGELIGNVVRHGGSSSDFEIAVDRSGPRTVLHVMDRGCGFHHISRLPPDLYAENGRGLFLIAAMSAEFTVTLRPDGGSHARAVLLGGSRPSLTEEFAVRSKAHSMSS